MAVYTRPITYRPGTILRPCDLCGVRFRSDELVRSADGKFRCMRWCVEQTQLERDLIVAAADTNGALKTAPPPPYGVPYLFKDAYEQEGILLNFLAVNPIVDASWTGGIRMGAAPAATLRSLGRVQVTAGSYSLRTAGETMRYLYGLITENKRPLQWITLAKAKLRELADWAISLQTGFGVSPTLTKSNAIGYGQVAAAIGTLTADQGRMGLGLVYAYLALGDVKYLTSARAVADYVTNMQSGGLLSASFKPSSTDAAGSNPINYGTWTRTANGAGNSSDHVYQPDSLVCLEFLRALYNIVGDEMHGADTTITGHFTQVPQQLLSVSMAAARAFWSTGCFDAVTGTTVNGFTSTAPREFFNSYPTTKAIAPVGTGSWEYQDGGSASGTLITASNWAVGLRALYAYEGYSAQVSSIWTWLMGFISNPAFLPTSTSRSQDTPTTLSLLGTYNPKLSLTTLLQVRTATFAQAAMNGSSTYDWQCAGMLSPIQGAKDPGSLDSAKDYVTKGVVFATDFDYGRNGTDYFMCQGLSGLSGQITATPPATVDWRADLAAAIGQMFRCGTTAFPLQV